MANCSHIDRQSMPLFGELFSSDEKEESSDDRLLARQILLNRIVEACEAYLLNKLVAFDPSVGDQACQIRSLNFCLLARENHSEDINNLKKDALKTLEIIDLLRKQFLQFERERDEQIAVIKQEKLAPLVVRNKQISDDMAKAFVGVKRPTEDQRQPFIERFSAVCAEKKLHEASIKTLNESCEAKKSKLLDSLQIRTTEVALGVIRAYLLTVARERTLRSENGDCHYSEHTRERLLAGCCKFPAKLMGGIMEAAKRALAESSLQFVKHHATMLSQLDAPLLRSMVAEPRENAKGQRELPFFHLTRIIFERALELQVPVELRIRNIECNPLDEKSYVGSLRFEGESGEYKIALDTQKKAPAPAIVIIAFSRAKPSDLADKKFLAEMVRKAGGLLRLIDLNAVQHTQYTDQSPGTPKAFDAIPRIDAAEIQRLTELRMIAEKEGFSNKNPQLCCIDHIFSEAATTTGTCL
jgi:hypothetical protein